MSTFTWFRDKHKMTLRYLQSIPFLQVQFKMSLLSSSNEQTAG